MRLKTIIVLLGHLQSFLEKVDRQVADMELEERAAFEEPQHFEPYAAPHPPGFPRRGMMGIERLEVPAAASEEEPGRATLTFQSQVPFRPEGAQFSIVNRVGDALGNDPTVRMGIEHMHLSGEIVVEDEMQLSLLDPRHDPTTKVTWPELRPGSKVTMTYVNRNPYPVDVFGTFLGWRP